MNDLQRLAQAVLREFPDADLKIERNQKSEWLDVEHEGFWVVVEWRPGTGFGVSMNEIAPEDPTKGLFQGPDDVFPDWSRAKDQVLFLLHSSSRSAGKKRSA